MKTRIVILFTILSLTTTFCSVVDDLLTFTISEESSLTINSGLPIDSPMEIPTPEVTTNSSSDFENNNTKASLVKDVRLTELKLTITYPADQNFDFLKSVHLYISTDSTDEIELAFLDNISSEANSIDLTCTSEKLDKYIKASSFKLRTKITTRKTTTQNIDVKANMKFKVTADPL